MARHWIPNPKKDWTERVFGKSVVLKEDGIYRSPQGRTWPLWAIQCSCGNIFHRSTIQLAKGVRRKMGFWCSYQCFCNSLRKPPKIKPPSKRVEFPCGCVKEGKYYVALARNCVLDSSGSIYSVVGWRHWKQNVGSLMGSRKENTRFYRSSYQKVI